MVDACKLIEDYPDVTGVLPLLFSIRDCVPIAFPATLLVIFFIMFGAQYFLIKTKTGRAKVLIAMSSSSFVTVILAMFLTLSQLISYKILLLWTLISILSFMGLVFSDKQ